MTRREIVELILIGAAVAGTWVAGALLPRRLALGEIILAGSVVLLGQGLLRDLWIKYGAPRFKPVEPPPSKAVSPKPRKITCLCVESAVGAAGVVAGCALLLVGLRLPVNMSVTGWTVLAFGVLLLGFLIKDLVLDWQAKAIRREPDHTSIIFW